MRIATGALALLAASAVAAAAQPSPLSVNDCTLLPDPGALRRCLDQAEGRVVAPLPPVASPAPVDRPEQPAQSVRGAPAAKPAAPPADFLGNRGAPVRSAQPSSRKVIELE
ncbi:hypothetical protein LOK46_24935 [Methylobacterium sp. NMS14P]|uniref:hypothetical protein n=1 Tax=Methylobacterium sp. NMS14P TaxID=2894310 RepID=UPI002359BC70|nr:hypothetical protein [Methylobacterium sp. NMS14P]WCS24345.1 hypothetical protein LOK46_24935 [Methylobacterium sp. NMS14P]